MFKTCHSIRLSLLVVAAVMLQGCSTTLGYYKDHPSQSNTGEPPSYSEVTKWAYDVADGYSSRGTMNRYSIYMAGALAAGGVGAVTGLAATGYTGHANVIIPVTAGFLATLFGYYQNEDRAKLYHAASASILTLIEKSKERLNYVGGFNDNSSSNDKPAANAVTPSNADEDESPFRASLREKIDRLKEEAGQKRTQLKAVSNKFRAKKDPEPEEISEMGKLIVATNAEKVRLEQQKQLNEGRITNFDKLKAAADKKQAEASCLTKDVYMVMNRVQIHINGLLPENIKGEFEKVNGAGGAKPSEGDVPSAEDSADTTPVKPPTDLSDLNPETIASGCDIGE